MGNIAVIGGAGFVGSHLSEKLVANGDMVTIIDNLEHGHNEVEGAHIIQMDATVTQDLAVALRGHDTVYNLAATVGGIYFNIDNQNYQLISNANLQVVPLMASQVAGVERFLQVSSVCVYDPEIQEAWNMDGEIEEGVPENVGLHGRPQHANAGYAWAKRMGEEAAALSGIPHVVIVRPSNIGGARDYFDEHAHVIPALIQRAFRVMDTPVMIEKKPMQVYGNPDFVREFIHVDDVADGMMAAMESGTHGETYNLGSGELITIRELALVIAGACWRERADANSMMSSWLNEIEFMGGEGGDPYRKSSTIKMDRLGWKAERTIYDIVEDTIQWYRQSQL